MAEIIVTSTADSGAGSLRQAIAKAQDGDVILFDSDVFPVGETTSILLSSYLKINKSVSIYGGFSDGAGGYTSGATITHYVKREIDGVETEVVVDDEHPAAEGEIILMHVTTRVAIDGQATQDPNHTGDWDGWTGSRVFAYYGANVVDATFSGVTCRNGLSTTSMYGGCFSLVSTSAQDAKINVVDCAFINGIRTNGGSGGICIDVPNGGATFTRCEFSGFKTQSTGGVYINSGQNTFSDCTFSTNTANFGGAVYSYGTSANTFSDCTFSTNTATNYGGAASSYGTSANTFSDCTFSTNTANYGGAVSSYGTSANTFSDCTFSTNTATNGGGVCSTSASQNTLTNCTITDCSATSIGGGVCSASTSQNTLNDCTITDCSATYGGGGFYSNNSSQNTLNDCAITGCSAANGGGVCSTGTSQNTLNGCIFNSCDAKNGGGFITGSSATNVLTDCTFTNCTASSNGGGVYFDSSSNNTFIRGVVTGCSSGSSGGGGYASGSSINSYIDCEFRNCTATTYGGGVYAGSTSQNTLNDCTFDASSTVYVVSTSALTITGGITTIAAATFSAASITINDGAALTLTDTATIGAAKFTSDGRGYLAVGAGIDTSAATLTNVVLCAYGADVSSFAEVDGVLEWSAADPTTTVLIERADGDSWATVAQPTGESLTLYLPPSDTVRLFDGVQFFTAQAPSQRTYYYIGGSEGSFTSAADWSLRRGGAAITEPPVVAGQRFIVGDISSGE